MDLESNTHPVAATPAAEEPLDDNDDLPSPVMVQADVSLNDTVGDAMKTGACMVDLEEIKNDDGNGGPCNFKAPPRKMTSTTVTSDTSSVYTDDDYDTMDYRISDPNKSFRQLDALHECHIEDHCEGSSVCSSKDKKFEEEEGDSDEPSRCWIWTKRLMASLFFLALMLLIIIFSGAAIEKRKVNELESTEHFYNTPQVCGIYDPFNDPQGNTFDSSEEVHEAGAQIAHCGDCGACSTSHDMEIMAKTKDTLTKDSTVCAFRTFFGRKQVEKCMEDRIGFTPACEECWLDNIQCSFQKCKFTCLKYKLFRQENNGGDGDLNDCLECDERRCGPAFITCSGANRRRMGIISDIGRNADTEQCPFVDVDWNHAYDQE